MIRLRKDKTQAESKTPPKLSWEEDVVLNERHSRILAWRVATAAGALLVVMTICLALLIPLKQAIPYVITVDKQTGEAQLASTAPKFLAESDLTHKYWIREYVVARERYIYKLLQHDYDTVRVLAGPALWKEYSTQFEGPNALDKKVGDSVEAVPSILSIVLHADNTATVRYDLVKRDTKQSTQSSTSRRIATLKFTYQAKTLVKEADLIANPLGFTIVAYHTDQEYVKESTPSLGATP
jgi:type IV secretion system protein VirB8